MQKEDEVSEELERFIGGLLDRISYLTRGLLSLSTNDPIQRYRIMSIIDGTAVLESEKTKDDSSSE